MFDINQITESRMKSALQKDMTPLRIFLEEESGIFAGSEGKMYDTTLDQCSCADFAIQGYSQPCKHMIRLAMDLGKIPSDGVQADEDSAKAKYFLGKAKQFIHEGNLPDVINFVKIINDIILFEKCPQDDAFAKSIDVQSIGDCPLFKVMKNGKVKIDKRWSKEFNNLTNIIRNRMGVETISRLYDDEFVAVFCKGD